jgi:hypothetical protein
MRRGQNVLVPGGGNYTLQASILSVLMVILW